MFTKYYKYTLSTVAVLLTATSLSAGEIPFTTFEANTTAKASEVNDNFLYLQSNINAKQNRVVAAGCAVGSSIRVINEDGSVVCQADTDTDTDTNTVHSAGFGLNMSGVEFSIDTAETQRRVTGTCAAGWSIRAISDTGSVTCEQDTDTNSGGDITGVTAGPGLTGGGTSGTVTIGLPATGRITVGHYAFRDNYPTSCSFNNNDVNLGYYSSTTTATNCVAFAVVNIPSNTTVTKLTCRLINIDQGAPEPIVNLLGYYRDNRYLMATVTQAIGGPPEVEDTSIDYASFQNHFGYILEFISGDPANSYHDQAISHCYIDYEY